VFTLECPTPPTLSLSPRARPLKTSQSEHHQIIAPQRSQLRRPRVEFFTSREGKKFALGPTIFVGLRAGLRYLVWSTSYARWDNGHEDNSPENGTCRTMAESKPQAGVANG
jgi:hypothetical protein